jgi:hypothetical protein
MMVNCPKCGFSQPEDQYCAKCGVDMVVYRAKARSSRSLFSNPILQVSTFVVVVFACIIYVRSSNKARLERLAADTPIVREADQQESELAQAQAEAAEARRQMNETNVASVGAMPAQAPPPPAAASSQSRFSQSSAPLNAAGGPTAPANAAAAVGTSTTAPTAPTAAGIRAALQPAQNVRVYFIEARRGLLTELLNDARESSGDGTTSYGVIPNLDQRLRQLRGWQSLDSSPDQAIRLNQPNIVFKGTRDQATGQNIGLTVQVIPLSRDEAGTHLQIDAARTLRDPVNGTDSFTFQLPESFTIPKGGSFIMTGVLPHRSLAGDEPAIYRGVNVLKPMVSDQFRNGATDVAIIIQAH